jgi:hypothetical protein
MLDHLLEHRKIDNGELFGADISRGANASAIDMIISGRPDGGGRMPDHEFWCDQQRFRGRHPLDVGHGLINCATAEFGNVLADRCELRPE